MPKFAGSSRLLPGTTVVSQGLPSFLSKHSWGPHSLGYKIGELADFVIELVRRTF